MITITIPHLVGPAVSTLTTASTYQQQPRGATTSEVGHPMLGFLYKSAVHMLQSGPPGVPRHDKPSDAPAP